MQGSFIWQDLNHRLARRYRPRRFLPDSFPTGASSGGDVHRTSFPDDVDIDEKPTLTDNDVVDDSCTTPDGLEGQCVSLSDCPPLLQVSSPF